jgi:hypothetical protein
MVPNATKKVAQKWSKNKLRFEQFLGVLSRHFRVSILVCFGPGWSILAPSWPWMAHLGPSWPHLGPGWPHLGPCWSHLGPEWPILAPGWPMLVPSWPQDGDHGQTSIENSLPLAEHFLVMQYCVCVRLVRIRCLSQRPQTPQDL